MMGEKSETREGRNGEGEEDGRNAGERWCDGGKRTEGEMEWSEN